MFLDVASSLFGADPVSRIQALVECTLRCVLVLSPLLAFVVGMSKTFAYRVSAWVTKNYDLMY